LKAWYQIPIVDNNEKLISIPCNIKLIEPHPYLTLGAPYKNKSKLWSLRESVVLRLMKANKYLKTINKKYALILYDTYRPIEVQSFMFLLSFKIECKKRGLRISTNDMNSYPEVIKEVEKFWAYPCFDIKSPPPHSTGGAIDLGIVDNSGNLIDMGCEIDAMHKSARPDFYNNHCSKEAKVWNKRRMILKQVMSEFGFVQHPNEWWHFSYGDQLWAWINNNKNAIYGKII
tara:strand:+ start:58 stop:747 length:690 start_codon:yes stop_codon:yes gene_type:complete